MHQSGHSRAHSMQTVQFSSNSAITPRERGGRSGATSGYCRVVDRRVIVFSVTASPLASPRPAPSMWTILSDPGGPRRERVGGGPVAYGPAPGPRPGQRRPQPARAREPQPRFGLAQRAEPQPQPVPVGERPRPVRAERRLDREQPGAVPVQHRQAVPAVPAEDPQGTGGGQFDRSTAPAVPDQAPTLDRQPDSRPADRVQFEGYPHDPDPAFEAGCPGSPGRTDFRSA